jgi:hypothetical protein
MLYDDAGVEKDPPGYMDDKDSGTFRFDQTKKAEVNGGNWYFNLAGNPSGGGGSIRMVNSANPHPDEFWIDDNDPDKLDWYWVYYNTLYVVLKMIDRFEDHIPFKGVNYVFEKIKRKKVTREREWEIQPPNEFGLITSIAQDWEIIEEDEQEVSFEFTLPDDIDLAMHGFDSNTLTLEKLIEGGYIFPKNGGNRHDGTPVDGYEALRYELKENLYELDPERPELGKYQVSTKEIEITTTYDLTDIMDNCSPPAFYNQ